MFGQVFGLGDLPVIGLLILLEGVMSIDNALVLGLLAKRVRPEWQKPVLTYGLIGAFVFRVIAISVTSFLLTWHIVKLLGGHAIDFHSAGSPWFWGFWVAMSLSFLFGFLGAEKNARRLEHARHHPH